jgi:hypothetical protein
MNSQPVRLRGLACMLCLFLVSCAEQQPQRASETELAPRPHVNAAPAPDTLKFRSILEDERGQPLSGVVEFFGIQARWLGVRVLLPGESEHTRSLVVRGSQGNLRQAITIPPIEGAVGTSGGDGMPESSSSSKR